MPYVYATRVVMDGSNQAIFVSANVENRELLVLVDSCSK